MKKTVALLASMMGFAILLNACQPTETGPGGTGTTPGTVTSPTVTPTTSP
ncbi:MAG: hypothetical protein KME17_10600 [Cyanosarcina radialis HA8281-LM2]|jgi:hypothetical protein|nr:hypothetical protein [Cyanosarcina radialis HA8281-LM2]